MKTFFFSDPHFGHTNIIKFQNRPFQTATEMDEKIITNWNSVVSTDDQVYLLGDVSFYDLEKTKEILDCLNGKIYLILGNHDRYINMELMDRFETISSYPMLFQEVFLLSHEPVFLTAESPFCNIHGHIHNRSLESPLYINVSAESIDYTPISFAEVKKIEGVKDRMRMYSDLKRKHKELIDERHVEVPA